MGSPWKAPCSAPAVYTVGESHRGRLVFLESRDRQLQHANVSCVDDVGRMLGELHDHGVGALHPFGARDVQIVDVTPAEDRADLRA